MTGPWNNYEERDDLKSLFLCSYEEAVEKYGKLIMDCKPEEWKDRFGSENAFWLLGKMVEENKKLKKRIADLRKKLNRYELEANRNARYSQDYLEYEEYDDR